MLTGVRFAPAAGYRRLDPEKALWDRLNMHHIDNEAVSIGDKSGTHGLSGCVVVQIDKPEALYRLARFERFEVFIGCRIGERKQSEQEDCD
jgi:hypothetical protein